MKRKINEMTRNYPNYLQHAEMAIENNIDYEVRWERTFVEHVEDFLSKWERARSFGYNEGTILLIYHLLSTMRPQWRDVTYFVRDMDYELYLEEDWDNIDFKGYCEDIIISWNHRQQVPAPEPEPEPEPKEDPEEESEEDPEEDIEPELEDPKKEMQPQNFVDLIADSESESCTTSEMRCHKRRFFSGHRGIRIKCYLFT
ncbi:uncharacterized protein LOC111398460 isoform X2 [Olea europaea var. sylvestris]|uniref:uncharacterized protein LOC111398460 isoform X2 n=1 Tax=Olea europaea var. sylvestris TaxID=158386 RepID=UPI000C1CF705|nr:uncharacterized protein LOC111398460 isoform X2 [Olea europaea var. sylvestris]